MTGVSCFLEMGFSCLFKYSYVSLSFFDCSNSKDILIFAKEDRSSPAIKFTPKSEQNYAGMGHVGFRSRRSRHFPPPSRKSAIVASRSVQVHKLVNLFAVLGGVKKAGGLLEVKRLMLPAGSSPQDQFHENTSPGRSQPLRYKPCRFDMKIGIEVSGET